MILGVGIDVTPIERLEKALSRWGERLESRLFTDEERAECRGRGRPGQHLAARFAAKEAALKALGVPAGLSWRELEVRSAASGAPSLLLHGRAAAAAAALGVARLHLSLTHAGGVAVAVVVAEGA